jgi:simple sugar transport system substrate-binding protein
MIPERSLAAPTAERPAPIPAALLDDTRPANVAFIRGLDQGDFIERLVDGARAMAAQLGVRLHDMQAHGQQELMPELVDRALELGFEAIILSHGAGEFLLPSVLRALEAGVRVVSFDTVLDHPQVPEIEQDDMALGLMVGSHLAMQHNGTADVIYINEDLYAPLVKRDRMWQEVKWRYPGLRELAQLRTVRGDVVPDTTRALAEALEAQPHAGVVLAMWNELVHGALAAIAQTGRAESITVYGVDITDEDIRLMREPGSCWTATVATDAAAIGRLAVRAAVALIGGESLPKYLLVEPVLITQQLLREKNIASMDDLVAVLPQLAESELVWPGWMAALLVRNGHAMPLLGTRVIEALHASEANLREVVEQQRLLLETITELSTPVVPVHDHTLLLPLIGTIDTRRSAQIMDALLTSVQRYKARHVIIDITGVPLVDTAVASHLIQATRALRLLGAESVVVGVSPEVAQTVVQLGIDVQSLTTRSTTQAGIAYALARQGIVMRRSRPDSTKRGTE